MTANHGHVGSPDRVFQRAAEPSGLPFRNHNRMASRSPAVVPPAPVAGGWKRRYAAARSRRREALRTAGFGVATDGWGGGGRLSVRRAHRGWRSAGPGGGWRESGTGRVGVCSAAAASGGGGTRSATAALRGPPPAGAPSVQRKDVQHSGSFDKRGSHRAGVCFLLAIVESKTGEDIGPRLLLTLAHGLCSMLRYRRCAALRML